MMLLRFVLDEWILICPLDYAYASCKVTRLSMSAMGLRSLLFQPHYLLRSSDQVATAVESTVFKGEPMRF